MVSTRGISDTGETKTCDCWSRQLSKTLSKMNFLKRLRIQLHGKHLPPRHEVPDSSPSGTNMRRGKRWETEENKIYKNEKHKY